MTAKVEKKQAETKAEVKTTSESKGTTRMIVEVPTQSVRNFKVLCDLVGVTQGQLVAKALDKYVTDNKELVEQFVTLRTQVSKNIK